MGGVQSTTTEEEFKRLTLHVSCDSDTYDSNMAGMCLVKYKGQTDWHLNGHHCKSAYILIKKSSNIDHINSNRGQVHGKLYKWFFDEEPGPCTDVDGYGFSIHRGVWKSKSWTINDLTPDGNAPTGITNRIRRAVENYWNTGNQDYTGS